jgi:hypothetical protein
MPGKRLATLYYQRWPLQENAFKEGEAVALAEHRGNSGTIVSNVAIVTQLERLEQRAERDALTLAQLEEEKTALERARREHEQARKELTDDRRRLTELAEKEGVTCEQFAHELRAHGEAHQKELGCAEKLKWAETQDRRNEHQKLKVSEELERTTKEIKKLEPQKTIRQLDVALDRVLTAMKLAASFLISFVMREYLGSMPMTAATFVAHVLSLRGRREVRPDEERVVFYENRRHPEVMKALADACGRLNARGLQRNGRRLHYEIEAPPNANAALKSLARARQSESEEERE